MRWLFIILAGLSSALFAQPGRIGPVPFPAVREQPITKSTGTCEIDGEVRDAITGEPLQKASLVLRRTGTSPSRRSSAMYNTATDEQGRFAFKDVEPGTYRLSGSHAGYISREYGARELIGAGSTFAFEAGHQFQDIVLRLTPHAVLAGRVADERGEPLSSVQVNALGYRYNRGRRQLTSFGAAVTNDLGEYRIFGLPPGRYYLSATYRSGAFVSTDVGQPGNSASEDYTPTYYPRGNDPTFATTIEARPGAQLTGIDFVLSKSPTLYLRGRVNNPAGAGMATLLLAPDDQTRTLGLNRTYVTDSQGRFEIRGIPPGAYTVIASILSRERSLSARQRLNLTADVDGFELTLRPGVELTGQVRVEGDRSENVSGVRISLQPRDARAVFSALPTIRVRDDGSFILHNVTPNKYSVAAVGLPDGYYIKSVKTGDNDVLETGFTVDQKPVGSISVVVSPGAGTVEGAVLDDTGRPSSEATVVLVPQNAKHREQVQFYKVTTTDLQGRFAIGNVVPGAYKLFAWENVEFDAWVNNEFLAENEEFGMELKVAEHSRTIHQLNLINSEAVRTNRSHRRRN